MYRLRVTSTLLLASLSLSAQAQDARAEPSTPPAASPAAETPAGPPPAAQPTAPAAQPAAPPSAQLPARPPAPPAATPGASTRARCILGQHDGIDSADARTSSTLVCQALRERGVQVDTQPSRDDGTAQGTAYRVELMRLGYVVVLRVSHEAPLGTPRDSRSLRLSGVEEVATAAPRIADSLVDGTALEETAKVDSLVGEETQMYSKKYGETLFGFGIFGFAIPGSDVVGGYGAFGRLYYETPSYAFSLDLRVGGSGERQGDAGLVGISVGGRYFLNEAGISPFIGGGLGIMWLSMDEDGTYATEDFYSDYDQLSGSGIAAYAEVGVEFLRFHSSRVDLLLRADAPFYELEAQGDSRYALPISLMASYSFE